MKQSIQARLGVTKQLLKNRLRKNKGKRRYIHPRLGVEGFFRTLNERQVNYAVLRWFESLPHVDDGEDIDILVADEDLFTIEPLLTGTKNYGTPCDIYTTSGLPGTSYRGIAYYPEHLARELLDSAVLQDDLVRVPDPLHHLLSMAYHVTYHKGYESGLPSKLGERAPEVKADHDYAEVLTECARKTHLPVPEMSLEGLHSFLREHEWGPSRDALEKLSARNEWIGDYFFSEREELDQYWNGFSVFIIRERGLEFLDTIRDLIMNEGFEILTEQEITGRGKDLAKRNLRGGNWNRGPWPVSGGLPAYLLAVDDTFPREPNEKLRKKHPGLTNQRIFDTKIRIRDAVNELLPRGSWCNVLHSADNPHQAIEYYQTAVPEAYDLDMISDLLKGHQQDLVSPYPPVRVLDGHGRRAKVEVVDYKGSEAVCKTYRPGRERFLERELHAREVGAELEEMSPILEYGSNYVILPKYEDISHMKMPLRPLFQKQRFLPVWVIARTRNVIRFFRSRGYELIDFKPKNIIIDKNEGMKVIDFEFMQQGGSLTDKLRGNYCWYTVPDSFSGDVPATKRKTRKQYYRHWFAATGIPLSLAVRNVPNLLLTVVQVFGLIFISFVRGIQRIKSGLSQVLFRLKRAIISLLGKLV